MPRRGSPVARADGGDVSRSGWPSARPVAQVSADDRVRAAVTAAVLARRADVLAALVGVVPPVVVAAVRAAQARTWASPGTARRMYLTTRQQAGPGGDHRDGAARAACAEAAGLLLRTSLDGRDVIRGWPVALTAPDARRRRAGTRGSPDARPPDTLSRAVFVQARARTRLRPPASAASWPRSTAGQPGNIDGHRLRHTVATQTLNAARAWRKSLSSCGTRE